MSSLEERFQRLEQRNEALEAQNRRIRRLGLGGLAVVGIALLMGQAAAPKDDPAQFKAVKATMITLVDENGKTRLELGTDKSGAGVDVRDANGKVRVVIGEGVIEGLGEGAGLWVFDEKERPRVGIGSGKHGHGMVVLDENGKPVAGQGQDKP
jgi:hypothetical protein